MGAILNLSLAFATVGNSEFANTEILGRAVVGVIVMNTATNTLFSLGDMVLRIYHKLKAARDIKSKKIKPNTKVASVKAASPASGESRSSNLPRHVKNQSPSLLISPTENLSSNHSGSSLINGISQPNFIVQNFIVSPPTLK